ncbi:HNH endonuclease [Gordonia spumicola]|nr:HNH endonuclease [Gordonia spumicola]
MPPRPRAARYARRRKLRMAQQDHDLTADQWASLQDEWGGCAYCGAAGPGLQKDCMLPISRGGRYTLDNVVPSCRSCNSSKCNAELTSWMRRKKLDERLFLERHYLIRRRLAE